ncbi:MAG: cytochrome c oxidase subunit II [Alphaproteobacteria bacterium]
MRKKFISTLAFMLANLLSITGVMADKPRPWQWNFQESVTPVMDSVIDLHTFVFIVICVIGAFVLGLLFFILLRFRASKNPSPSTRSHNPTLEIVWTAIPTLILLVIAVPSFKLLYFMDKTSDPEMTIKISGNAWFWNYDYVEQEFAFDSTIIPDNELQPGQLRLLSVDNEVVVPVDTNVRLIMTATDVLHSWAIPAFGVKMDCVPGRLNETWIRVTKPGLYYGQCSELCGMKHGFMPIAVRAVSKDEYNSWLTSAKEKYA